MTYRGQLWQDIARLQAAEQESATELVRVRDTRPDLYDLAYSDTGCHVHPHCLSCPLAVCIYDVPERSQRGKMRLDEINGLLAAGWTAVAVAAHLNVSKRTIFRLRREHNGN